MTSVSVALMLGCKETLMYKAPVQLAGVFVLRNHFECAYEGGSFAFLSIFDFLGFGSR